MNPLSAASLLIKGLAGAAFAVLVNLALLHSGHFPLFFTFALGFIAVCVAGVLWVFGRRVRALRDGDHHAINPLVALRIVAFARASAVVCVALLGAGVGIMLTNLTRVDAPAVFESTLETAVSTLGVLVWMIVGILVEKWGRYPDEDSLISGASRPGQG